MLARNTRGSNITIPYARVVFHAPGNTALPAADAKEGTSSDEYQKRTDLIHRMMTTPSKAIATESEHLFFGRLAFVLGRRGTSYDSAMSTAIGLDVIAINGGQQVSGPLAHTSGGVATAQRLCSFEYLQRYFKHVLESKEIDIAAGPKDANDRPIDVSYYSKRLQGAFKGKTTRPPPLETPNAIDATAMITMMDDTPTVASAAATPQWKNQGADLENSIFLCGKTHSRMFTDKGANMGIGDEIFSKWLHQQLIVNGILDWHPDGIVMSKLSQGDRFLDDELDSRDGMLFNVAISGPAISTLWSMDKELEVMVLDKVFVLITAQIQGNTLKNFELKLSTSSQMVAAVASTSESKDATAQEAAVAAGLKMGIPAGRKIIGGWCVGHVIDSAASRAADNNGNTALSGAVKRTRINSAHNIVVDVRWWSSDHLNRNYGQRARRTRYDPPRERLPKNNALRPANYRRSGGAGGGGGGGGTGGAGGTATPPQQPQQPQRQSDNDIPAPPT